jgi:hypothetical protein
MGTTTGAGAFTARAAGRRVREGVAGCRRACVDEAATAVNAAVRQAASAMIAVVVRRIRAAAASRSAAAVRIEWGSPVISGYCDPDR